MSCKHEWAAVVANTLQCDLCWALRMPTGEIQEPAEQHQGGPVERDEPKSCDEANLANGPTFMGEPNPNHPIEWYREGISKHWKTICDQRVTIDRLTAALRFYAEREHYHFESGNWDAVSGEPLNILWCGDEPDFIEDGSVARAALERRP